MPGCTTYKKLIRTIYLYNLVIYILFVYWVLAQIISLLFRILLDFFGYRQRLQLINPVIFSLPFLGYRYNTWKIFNLILRRTLDIFRSVYKCEGTGSYLKEPAALENLITGRGRELLDAIELKKLIFIRT